MARLIVSNTCDDGQAHYRMMTVVMAPHQVATFRTICERCSEVIRIQGHKWVSELYVIAEPDEISWATVSPRVVAS